MLIFHYLPGLLLHINIVKIGLYPLFYSLYRGAWNTSVSG
mgnify:CR=1 FL=1